jgi:hypothetical protein
MLSGSESVSRGQIRGPQPETVKDYTVAVRKRGASTLTPVAEVKDNYLRLRRHEFAPAEAEALRIHVQATQGDPFARIFEIRCYA